MNETIDHEEQARDRGFFGFWVYLMTDMLMFAILFAVFAVLHESTAGGPSGGELFNLPLALTETILLLTSSFTCGLATLGALQKRKGQMLAWFSITFLLGVSFFALEMKEFSHLIQAGHTIGSSAYLSAFFVLVGTHGLHIFIGLFWMATLMIYTLKRGFTTPMQRKITYLGLYWHFLDIVWIFIFSMVYLLAGRL